MRLVHNEIEELLSRTADSFFADKAPVTHLRSLRDTDSDLKYDLELWREMAQLGWAGILAPESVGGSALGITAIGGVCEQAGKYLSPTPLLSTAVFATSILIQDQSEQSQALLKKICTGDIVIAVAVDETNRHLPEKVTTTATSNSEGYHLQGRKTLIIDAIGSSHIIVSARTSAEDISLFIVDTDSVQLTPLSVADSRNYAAADLDVTVPKHALIGSFDALQSALRNTRACLAAEMLGSAQSAFDQTITYLQEREQFGQKIGSFQSLQHRAADMFCQIENCRSAVMAALTTLTDGEADEDKKNRLVAMAKALANQCLHNVTLEAVQMHGGMGVTDELDFGLYLKRARTCELLFGTTSDMTDDYAVQSGF